MNASRRSSSLFSARAWNLRVIPVRRRDFGTGNSSRRSRSSKTSGRRNRRRRPRSSFSYHARRSRQRRQRSRYCISRTHRFGSSSRASTCRSYSGPYNKSLGDERLRGMLETERRRAWSAESRLTCQPSRSPYCFGSAGSRSRSRARLRYASRPSGSSRRSHFLWRASAHLRYSNAGLRSLSRLSATN